MKNRKTGFKYVGQTARCINDRLTEHKRNVRINASNSELARHLQECNACTANWSETEIVHKEREEMRRVVRETVRIKTSGNCISQASLQIGSESKKFTDYKDLVWGERKRGGGCFAVVCIVGFGIVRGALLATV